MSSSRNPYNQTPRLTQDDFRKLLMTPRAGFSQEQNKASSLPVIKGTFVKNDHGKKINTLKTMESGNVYRNRALERRIGQTESVDLMQLEEKIENIRKEKDYSEEEVVKTETIMTGDQFTAEQLKIKSRMAKDVVDLLLNKRDKVKHDFYRSFVRFNLIDRSEKPITFMKSDATKNLIDADVDKDVISRIFHRMAEPEKKPTLPISKEVVEDDGVDIFPDAEEYKPPQFDEENQDSLLLEVEDLEPLNIKKFIAEELMTQESFEKEEKTSLVFAEDDYDYEDDDEDEVLTKEVSNKKMMISQQNSKLAVELKKIKGLMEEKYNRKDLAKDMKMNSKRKK